MYYNFECFARIIEYISRLIVQVINHWITSSLKYLQFTYRLTCSTSYLSFLILYVLIKYISTFFSINIYIHVLIYLIELFKRIKHHSKYFVVELNFYMFVHIYLNNTYTINIITLFINNLHIALLSSSNLCYFFPISIL